MKSLIILAAFLFLQATAVAAPWHYGLLEDFQKSGDVGIVKNEGIQEMYFTLNYPKALVAKGVAVSLDQASLPIEATTRGTTTEHLTHWGEDPSSGLDAFFQLKKRKRYKVALTEIDPTTTGITFLANVEIAGKAGWTPAPGINVRNSIREVMAGVAIYCRFPKTEDVRALVYNDFKENGARVGKKGYELPPAEAWIDEQPPLLVEGLKATKTCPFCAEDILAEAIKCKHCGEFLNKSNSPERIPPAGAVLTQDTSVPSSGEVLLGEVIDNPANPNEAIGARGRLRIVWNSLRSVFILKIENTEGSGAFELAPSELIQFVTEYQKAKKVAQTLPAGKPVSTWQCNREEGSSIDTAAAQVPDVGLQVVLIGIREGDKSISSFAAPTWWPTDARLAMHYGEVSTYFEGLLAKALKVARAQIEASEQTKAPSPWLRKKWWNQHSDPTWARRYLPRNCIYDYS